jgi:2-methylisocitrate lyase-like PEP mutase family enzyme
MTPVEKGNAFKALHESGTFVLANFWNEGSALILERLGFQALATTSSGFAQSLGKLDGTITLEQTLEHCQRCAAITNVPVSADFGNGFADDPQDTAANLLRLAATGVVGASIEDWSGDAIYPHDLAVERIAACAEAVNTLGFQFTLTARADNLLHGVHELDDTINRLNAYQDAGADVLYAPGLASTDQIQGVLEVTTKPLNVLFSFMPDTTLEEFANLGVRRISLGGALANHATGATLSAANRMLEDGDFTWLLDAAPGPAIKQLLRPAALPGPEK